MDLKIRAAEFTVGAASAAQFPPPVLPEVAFAGKSNVGKSSLINSLLNRKHLVKTSSTPGKTRQINFFLINGAFRLVDLPGYGFSRVSKAEKARWGDLVAAYVAGRPALQGVVLIVDARHAPGPLDRQMVAWLGEAGVPFCVVANKVDKLKRAQRPRALAQATAALGLPEAPLLYSSVTAEGRGALWARLGGWLGLPEGA